MIIKKIVLKGSLEELMSVYKQKNVPVKNQVDYKKVGMAYFLFSSYDMFLPKGGFRKIPYNTYIIICLKQFDDILTYLSYDY